MSVSTFEFKIVWWLKKNQLGRVWWEKQEIFGCVIMKSQHLS